MAVRRLRRARLGFVACGPGPESAMRRAVIAGLLGLFMVLLAQAWFEAQAEVVRAGDVLPR